MKIPDLGQKLAYIKSVSKFIYLTQLVMNARRSNLDNPVTPSELDSYLRENRIADQIGVSEAQWSRIKKGKDSIDETVSRRFQPTSISMQSVVSNCSNGLTPSFRRCCERRVMAS